MNDKSTSLLNGTFRTVWGWLALLLMSAILCGCSGDDPEPMPTPTPEPEPEPTPVENHSEIGQVICGDYTGYFRIIKGIDIKNHYINDVKLSISERER